MPLLRPIAILAGTALVFSACGDGPAAPRGAARIELAPFADTVGVGDTLAPVTQVFDRDGNLVADAVPRYESANPAVLVVLADGRLRAVGGGTATVRARVGGVVDSVAVTVTRRPRMLRVVPARDSIHPGIAPLPRVYVADGLGDSLGVAGDVTWGTSEPSVLGLETVGSTTRLRTADFGAADVIATSGPLTGRARVRVVPLQVFAGLAGIEQVTMNADQVCVRTAAGQAYCTGNGLSTLITGFGDARQTTPHTAAQLAAPIVDLSANNAASCARASATDIYCWGVGLQFIAPGFGIALPTRIPLPDSVAAVASLGTTYFSRTVCLVAVAGSVDCAGLNTYGNLGPGGSTNGTFRRIAGLPPVTRVAIAETYGCAVTGAGALWCWGSEWMNPHVTTSLSPTLVALPVVVRDVAPSASDTCVLDDAGAVHCWGGNSRGGSGQPAGTPVTTLTRVPIAGRFLRIRAGHTSTCALSDAGELWCWGEMTGRASTAPFRFMPDLTFKAFTASGYFARGEVCGVATDGRVLCSTTPTSWSGIVP